MLSLLLIRVNNVLLMIDNLINNPLNLFQIKLYFFLHSPGSQRLKSPLDSADYCFYTD